MNESDSKSPYCGCKFHDLNTCGKGKHGREKIVKVVELGDNTENHFNDLKVDYSNISIKYLKEQHLIENRSGRLLSEVDEICPKTEKLLVFIGNLLLFVSILKTLVKNQKTKSSKSSTWRFVDFSRK